MKEANTILLILVSVMIVLVALLIISILKPSPPFETAICKETHMTSTAYPPSISFEYRLVDINGNHLAITKQVYDALELCECEGR